jgi:hypothetical protein
VNPYRAGGEREDFTPLEAALALAWMLGWVILFGWMAGIGR